MNRIVLVLFAAGTLAANAAGQPQAGAQAGAQASGQASADVSKQGAQASTSGSAAAGSTANVGQTNAALASGSAFNATLSAPLDSRKCKPGDAVTARSTEPDKSKGSKGNGKTEFPKGTKFVGHVTQASSRAKGDSESAIGMVFDKAILKNGEEVPVNFAIRAIASAEGNAAVAGSSTAAGRGALGGVTSTAGGAVGTVTNTAANVGGTAGGTLNSTAGAAGNVAGASKGAVGGLNSAGQLTSNSQGVFGLNGLSLNSAVSNETQGSVIASTGKNVHLDSGTRMLLVSQTQAGSAAGEAKQPKSDKPEPKSEPKSRPENLQ